MGPRRHRLTFDDFSVDPESRELFCGDQSIPIQDQPFRLLLTLLERAGEVVSRSELSDVLWPPEAFVDREAGLNTAIRKLRVALRRPGDDAEILQTIPRVGYRLRIEPESHDVDLVDAAERQASAEHQDRQPQLGWKRVSWGLAAAVLLAAGLVFMVNAWSTPPTATSTLPAWPPARSEALPEDPAARGAYLEARSLLASDDQLERAQQQLDVVVETAPFFADGHAHLAETTLRMVWQSGAFDEVESARRSAETAQRLDPRSAVAQRALGLIALFFDWRLDDAERHVTRAITLDPSDAFNHLARATLASVHGDHDTAITAIDQAIRLDPESMPVRSDAGYFLLRAGRYAEALDACELVLRLDPEHGFARHCLVEATRHTGDIESSRHHALAALQPVERFIDVRAAVTASPNPGNPYRAWRLERLRAAPSPPAAAIAGELLAVGETGEALDWLERAAANRDPGLVLVPGTLAATRAVTELPAADAARYREILQHAGLGQLVAPAASHGSERLRPRDGVQPEARPKGKRTDQSNY